MVKRFKIFLFPLQSLLLLFFGAGLAAEREFLNRIEEDLSNGRIDEISAIELQLQAVYEPQELPVLYQQLAVDLICDPTPIKAKAKRFFVQANDAQRARLQRWFQRPDSTIFSETIVSPAGYFKIHYAKEGSHKTDPEFARQCAAIYDQVYEYEIDVLGYQTPPSDNYRHGPEYDVYMRNISAYGCTTEEELVPGAGNRAFNGFVEMDNDFTHTPTKGLNAARVTAAHEFYHLIQLGYRGYSTVNDNERFFYEMSSTWMEDVVFDSINDYLFYLNSFFSFSHHAFHLFNGNHEYGSAIFLHMLEKKYGHLIVQQMWQELRNRDLFASLQAVLQLKGSSFNRELAEFSVWNIHTKNRADTVRYYPEGKNYPALQPKASYELSDEMQIDDQSGQLQTATYRFVTRIPGDYTVQPQFDEPSNWLLTAVTRSGTNNGSMLINSGNIAATLYDLNLDDEVWVSVINTRLPGAIYQPQDMPFTLQIIPGVAGTTIENKIQKIYPNPYLPAQHASVMVEYSITQTHDQVGMRILSATGQMIFQQQLGYRTAGYHREEWHGKNFAGDQISSGIYLVQIVATEPLPIAKIAVIR